jgi:beta-lactam-binding protein with PASTA domain
MELTYVTIIVLASMVFALAGMVGYLYWQQTRMLQHIQSLSVVVSSQLVRPEPLPVEEEPEAEPEAEAETKPESEAEAFQEEDDRVSVDEKVEVVKGPPAQQEVDVDDLQDKTASQLRDLLTQKGIPFGKRDSKTILIQLLKASS